MTREERREYNRQYREAHRQEVNAYARLWAKNHGEQINAINRRWRKRHPDKVSEWNRSARAKNGAKVRRYLEINRDRIRDRSRRYNKEHREEISMVNRRWRKDNPIRIQANRVRKYGITVEQYAAMLAEQKGVCAICGEPETSICHGKVISLSVDHDHRTGRVRALLCSLCNLTIGCAKESPIRLRLAAEYIEKHQC